MGVSHSFETGLGLGLCGRGSLHPINSGGWKVPWTSRVGFCQDIRKVTIPCSWYKLLIAAHAQHRHPRVSLIRPLYNLAHATAIQTGKKEVALRSTRWERGSYAIACPVRIVWTCSFQVPSELVQACCLTTGRVLPENVSLPYCNHTINLEANRQLSFTFSVPD